MTKNYYEILGISENDKNLPFDKFKDILKKKYRDSSKQYHPDLQQGKSDAEKKAAEDKFKEINEAYSVLSDPDKKQEYDNFGTIGGNMGGMGGGFSDIGDFIRNMHSSGGFNPFDGGFGPFGGGFNEQPIVNGDNVKIKLNCTIEDIYNKATKTIKYTRKVKCTTCNGTGSKSGEKTVCPHCQGTGMYTETKRISAFQVIRNTTTCPYCHGTGKIIKDPCRQCNGTGLEETKETIDIPIPIEARTGAVMSIPGMGHMAPNNMGQPGDMLVQFNVMPHSVYQIAENNVDLICKAKVNVFDCITGCEIQVNCINGNKKSLKIPAGTKHKQEFVISGQGMPMGNGRYGNLVVSIDQAMPISKLGKDDVKKLDELKHSLKF